MKSYKQRTLDAQKDLIRRYEENDPPLDCPFCTIYPYYPTCCFGCFLKEIEGKRDGGLLCQKTKSHLLAKYMWNHTESRRLARAEFHRKVRKILLKRPAKYFTPKGWKYLDIPKEW